jgi:ribonuclease BN (tRNA processing enzyme)
MSKFLLKSKLNSLLKNIGRAPIVEINFLGTGGAFDLEEKNSSAIIKSAAGTILVDCGSTVYSELSAKKLVESIDYIFITHCHEDHIGSLSTLVYHKYFGQNQTAKIECAPSLKPLIENYLLNVCGHMQESFVINSNEGVLYKELNMIIHKIDTTGFHYKNYPSGGFVFNFRKGGEDLFVIYSGDVNKPISEVILDTNDTLYQSLLKAPENVFIFHEATARDYPPFYPHCEYEKLEELGGIFPNIYVYHHSLVETKEIIKKYKSTKDKLDFLKKQIDSELSEKINLLKTNEAKEKLRVQAKKIKEDFEEELSGKTLKIQDLNIIGKELIIQEEMGL